METINKEQVSLAASIEHILVSNGILNFDINQTLNTIGKEEIDKYLSHKEGNNLHTIEDKETEKKLVTCIIRYLHENNTKNTKEENIQLCNAMISAMRATKLQLWLKSSDIDEVTYNKLVRKQKWAEIFTQIKYRIKIAPIGGALGAVIGVLLAAYFGLELLAAAAIAAAVGVILCLFLPKQTIKDLKEYVKHQIIPLLKNAIEKILNEIAQKIPQILNEGATKLLDKIKGHGQIHVAEQKKAFEKVNS